MSIEKIKNKIRQEAIPNTTWLAEAQWRQDNEAWLDISFEIAIRIGSILKQKNMTQKELAEKMACSPQFIHTVLKGSENLTLETICKLEKALDMQLINVVSTTTSVIDFSTSSPIVHLPKPKNYANKQQTYEKQDKQAISEMVA
jgi:transcriptional regulator with XRE-family HTH domain